MSIKSFIVIISFLAFIPRNDARLGGSIVDNLHDDSSTSIQKFSSHRYLTWFNDMVNSLGISSYNTIIDAKTLGATNFDAAVGNPLKGLLTSPRWVGRNIPDSVPSTLEFYYIGLDEIMTGWNQYDWTVLENTLRDAAARKTHVIWRIFCHYPGQRLRVPEFLIDAGIKLVSISDGGVSPQYDDPTLLRAFEQFIAALGERYDGHRSLAFLQLGLLGKWGEWHTYPDRNLISDSTKDKVVAWYSKAFTTTKMQIRNPRRSAYVSGVGLHDDSFAFSTLDGDANGGQNVGWFFWPKVKAAGETSFWRKGVMGGETRPEIQSSVFRAGYAAGTPFKQDFMKCVKTTHASYLLHNAAFQNGGYSGIELENALHAHTRMGYNFRVNRVEASKPQSQKVSIRVQVEQIGVAPFYYPLGLELSCQGYEGLSQGVDQLIDEGDSDWFIFHNIPATSECFDALEISLQSDLVYNERPVKFAQGVDGRVQFSLPPPDQPTTTPPKVEATPTSQPSVTTVTPTESPTEFPTAFPTSTPTASPVTIPPKVQVTSTSQPSVTPTKSPIGSPTSIPTASPTARPITSSPTSSPSPSPTESPSSAPVKSAVTLAAPSSFWEILLAWFRASMLK